MIFNIDAEYVLNEHFDTPLKIVLTHCLREPGVPCINSMGNTKSRRQRVNMFMFVLFVTDFFFNRCFLMSCVSQCGIFDSK